MKVFFKGVEITLKQVPKSATSTHGLESIMKNAEIFIGGNGNKIDPSNIVELLDNIHCEDKQNKSYRVHEVTNIVDQSAKSTSQI